MEKKKKYMIAGIVSVIIAILAGVYCGGVNYYRTHFFPGTKMNGVDCSNMNSDQVLSALVLQTASYELEILGRDLQTCQDSISLQKITADEINMVDIGLEELVPRLLAEQNQWLWFRSMGQEEQSHHISLEVGFDEDKLQTILQDSMWFESSKVKKPQNAYIGGYTQEQHCFIIVEDKPGTALDQEKTSQLIRQCIAQKETVLNLEEHGCYLEAGVKADDTELVQKVNEANRFLETVITYDWNGNQVVLDREQIKDWIDFEDSSVSINEDAVTNFVKQNAKAYDTYGKQRKFVTTGGGQVTLPGSSYGWKTDTKAEVAQLMELIAQGSVTEKEPVYSVKAAKKGANDIGTSYVEINLTVQHLYLYKKGSIVLESDFVSGNVSQGNTTPAGVFGITYKTTDAVLRGANYETPVKYWMPFNGNIGMHDATWRTNFGGDIYLTNGSHGCINLPFEKAKEIYNNVSQGFPVVCYY